MTAMTWSMRRPDGRSLRLGALAGMLAILLAIGAFAALGSLGSESGGSSAKRAEQLTAWEDAVHPLVLSAGQVVALGPRTGVSMIANRQLPTDRLLRMAAGWHDRLTALAGRLATVRTPTFLSSVHDQLDAAMRGYITATADLVAATTATDPERTALLGAASAAGRNADRRYDAAMAALGHWRARLGLAPDWSASS